MLAPGAGDLIHRGGNEMKHTWSLLNPFNQNQEPAKPARPSELASGLESASRHASRATPVCSQCRSDDIIAHATIQWSNESQEWELASTFGRPAHCNHCNSACEITWLPLN
jgi:hypothetical protein